MYGLSTGVQNPITQNVPYGMPAKLCYIMSSVALEASNDGTTWTALAGANTTGILAAAQYIRCPTANAVVVCKKY